MQKITRWSPDTCGCKVDIHWDTDNPNVHTHELIEACEAHKSNTGNDILLENQTKNKAIQSVAESSSDFAKLTDDGKVIPDQNKLSFEFDKDRKLKIITKVASADLAKIQSGLDAKFGTGKIILNG